MRRVAAHWRSWWLAALLVAVVALVACGDADAPATATATATTVADGGGDEEIDATLELVADRTEELFGFDSDTVPEISLIDDDDLAAVVDELLADPEIVASIRRG